MRRPDTAVSAVISTRVAPSRARASDTEPAAKNAQSPGAAPTAAWRPARSACDASASAVRWLAQEILEPHLQRLLHRKSYWFQTTHRRHHQNRY